jgi:hypothetical protein
MTMAVDQLEDGRADEIVDEARNILRAAAEAGITLRAMGGLGIRLHLEGEIPPSLSRPYRDIDFFAPKGSQAPIAKTLQRLGYSADNYFNASHGDRRLLFLDQERRHIDIFVGIFELCHRIPIGNRLTVDPMTLPLAELLLTKLQIVQLNEKDQRDIFALLLEHELGSSDDETVNVDVIGQALADDWGLWRTCTGNLARVQKVIGNYDLSPAHESGLRRRIADLSQHIDARPKSRRWRLRARVGERLRWYEEPEEEPQD